MAVGNRLRKLIYAAWMSPNRRSRFLVIDQGLKKMFSPEIGPIIGRDPDLRVGDLPEKEIRNAEFAARPDEKVGVGQVRGVQIAGKGFFVRSSGVYGFVAKDPLDGVHDLGPAAVVQGQTEVIRVVPGQLFDPLELARTTPAEPLSWPRTRRHKSFSTRTLSSFLR